MGNAQRKMIATAASTNGRTAPDEETPEFKSEMPFQAQVLARLLQNDYLGRIASYGIAPAQSFVLAELWYNEPLSQVDLARRLDIGKATIGQTLNRLERSGLILRKRQSTDRRVIMIHLTEQGRALRQPLEQAALEQRMMIRDLIGEDAVETISQVMTVAIKRLSQMGINAIDQLGAVK